MTLLVLSSEFQSHVDIHPQSTSDLIKLVINHLAFANWCTYLSNCLQIPDYTAMPMICTEHQDSILILSTRCHPELLDSWVYACSIALNLNIAETTWTQCRCSDSTYTQTFPMWCINQISSISNLLSCLCHSCLVSCWSYYS